METSGLGSRSLGAWVMAGTRGPRHASAYVCFWKNFLSFVLAQFALGIWCIISVVFVSGSYCSGRLSIAEMCGNLDFSGDVCFRWCNALYNSGYMLCVSTLVALDVFHTFSTLRQTRILKRFFSIRFEWRSVCPVDAPGCSFVLDVLS